MDAPRGIAADPVRAPARRALAWVVAAWIGAVLPLALGWFADTGLDRFAGVALTPLCALPWVFLAGLPRRAGNATPGVHELVAAALLAPPLGAAVGLDVAQGAPLARSLTLLGLALIAALVLGDAARRAAAGGERAAWLHAAVWFACVPAAPLAVYALEVGGGPFLGAAPALLRAWASASPLAILGAQVRDVALPLAISPAIAVFGALVLALVAAAASIRARAEEGDA